MSEVLTGSALAAARDVLYNSLRDAYRKTDDNNTKRLVDWLTAYLNIWQKDLHYRSDQNSTGMHVISSSYASTESPGKISFFPTAKATRPTVTTASKWLTRVIKEVALAPYDIYGNACKPLDSVEEWSSRIYPEPRNAGVKVEALIQTLQGLLTSELGIPEGFSHEIVEGPELILNYDIRAACMSYSGHYLNYLNLGHSKGPIAKAGYLDRHPGIELYGNNPDKVKMVILKEDNRKIGRVLLWHLDDGKIALDSRVYPSGHGQLPRYLTMISTKNGWIRTSSSDLLSVTLKATDCFPYLDTMNHCVIDGDDVTLFNKSRNNSRHGANTAGYGKRERGKSDTVFTMKGEAIKIPGGYASLMGGGGSVAVDEEECWHCSDIEMREDDNGNTYGVVAANGYWYCQACMEDELRYVDRDGEYYPQDDVVFNNLEEVYIYEDDAVFSEHHDTHLHVDDASNWTGGFGVDEDWFLSGEMVYYGELDAYVPPTAVDNINAYLARIEAAEQDINEVMDYFTEEGGYEDTYNGVVGPEHPNFLSWLKGTYHVEPVSTATVS